VALLLARIACKGPKNHGMRYEIATGDSPGNFVGDDIMNRINK